MIQIRRPEREEGSPTNFARGELVRHRRYGYRGVIVEFDLECRAPDAWYLGNKTQPRREQPWYHVLVDGGTHTTYAAEENLVLDHDPTPIQHPLLEAYFSAFQAGVYVRNQRPWDLGMT